MPVYEYRCRACGEEFEAFLMGASDLPRCPGCGGEDLQKKFSVPCCGGAGGGRAGCSPSSSGFSWGAWARGPVRPDDRTPGGRGRFSFPI